MNKKILQLAVPSIISNITVPLLGLVDVAIVGHLGATAYIGAIAIGGLFFSIIYWIFAFLRMGTSGMTAQAFGRRDLHDVAQQLYRACVVALLISVLLIAVQYPLQRVAFHFISTSGEVQELATRYFRICIWGAPAVLGLYVFSGWFIGMQNSRIPMYIAITQNIINVAVSFLLVFKAGMKVEGVALGTLVAQYCGLLMAIILCFRYYRRWLIRFHLRSLLALSAMKRFFRVNSDIFFRTICLVCVTTYFTSTGARQGDIILAVNTLLMQFFMFFSYIMDGFAYAGEALTGRFIGASTPKSLHRMIRLLFRWGMALALLFTFIYGVGGKGIIALLTNDQVVITESAQYSFWVIIIPLAGFAAFLWDGILIGATRTRYMLYSMLIASAAFFLCYFIFYPRWLNHALWFAFLVYLFLRGAMQWLFWKLRVEKKAG